MSRCSLVEQFSLHSLHIGESLAATNTGWRLNDQGHFSDVAEAFLRLRPKAPSGKEISYCFSLFQ